MNSHISIAVKYAHETQIRIESTSEAALQSHGQTDQQMLKHPVETIIIPALH
jgi:hypothetical protein